MMDAGNLRLRARHPQSHQGVCADAVATLEGITRGDVDALSLESQKRAAAAIKGGHFDKSLVPVHREDGSLALDREEYPRPQTTLEGLAGLKAALRRWRTFRSTTGHHLPQSHSAKIPRSRHRFRPPRRQFIRGRRWLRGDLAGVAVLRASAWPKTARARGRDGEHGRFADPDAQCAGSGGAQGAGQSGPHA